jgi:hypothetical protein
MNKILESKLIIIIDKFLNCNNFIKFFYNKIRNNDFSVFHFLSISFFRIKIKKNIFY